MPLHINLELRDVIVTLLTKARSHIPTMNVYFQDIQSPLLSLHLLSLTFLNAETKVRFKQD